jgi:hypothetical protein
MKERRRIHGFTILAALGLTVSQGLSAAVFHVGAGPECDTDSLQTAVTMAAATPGGRRNPAQSR